MTTLRERPVSAGYELVMLILCLYALATLVMETTVQFEPGTQTILDYMDYVVCALFFLDFTNSFWRAPHRWRYFYTWGWLDLVSSIPAIDVLRWGRAARVVRVFRVFRGMRTTKLLAELVVKRRGENTFLAASLVALLLVVFCSIAALYFEVDAGSNIKTGEDALWWALVTITTVGYGDRYPVTTEGRALAVFLMTAGVGLFSIFSAFLAARFIGNSADDSSNTSSELSALRTEMAEIRRILEQLKR